MIKAMGLAPYAPQAMHAPKYDQLFGHFMPLTPFHPNKNKSFVAPDGSIMACHKSAWLSHHPGTGDLWTARKI